MNLESVAIAGSANPAVKISFLIRNPGKKYFKIRRFYWLASESEIRGKNYNLSRDSYPYGLDKGLFLSK